MFAQLQNTARKFGLLFHALLISLVTLITGCDENVTWRDVGTDSKDSDHSQNQGSAQDVGNVQVR